MQVVHRLTCAALALGLVPSLAAAQVRASERAGVYQVVNGTKISVEYGRPQVRGRAPIYGGLEPWGKVWTPGANWATTIEVDKDVTVNGHALAKGTYAVWMQVQPEQWTVILDPKAKAFHTNPPKPDSAQVRFAVTPENQAGPEILTWSFTEVSASGCSLQMAWAGKAVTLKFEVPIVPPPPIAEGVAARYTGNYTIQFGPNVTATPAPAVNAATPPGLVVSFANGKLAGAWAHPPFEVWKQLLFLNIADDWFHPAAVVDGAIYDEVTDLVFEFALANGRATGFEIRGPGDRIVGRGTRIP